MKSATLKEIAQQLNISITTVSKALKNYADVSPATKSAVLELAKKLHYTPNSFAINLRTSESRLIGLIIPEVVHHFFSSIVNGIVAEAEKNDYLVIILQSNESVAMEKKQVELLINKRVDGILLSLSNESNNDEHIKEILRKEIPLVQFDKISKLINSSKVIINDQKAAAEAVQHLIDQGCTKIAHIRGPENPQNAIDRFLGYKKTLERNKIKFDPTLVYTCKGAGFDEGFEFMKQIISEHPDVDGVFAVTDMVAVGAITFLKDCNINVPNQVAIIGFSNWFMSQIITPKLSSVDQPSYKMGVQAFQLLLKEIKCKKSGAVFVPETIELKTKTIIRESSLKQKTNS